MEIGNQQGRKLYVDYKEMMLTSIDASLVIRKDFTVQDTVDFILNINETFEFLQSKFNLHRDQVKCTKRKVYNIFRANIPKGFVQLKEYPDYAINEYGVVIFIATRRILRQALNQKGYPSVCLSNKQTKTVHRLVAITFIPNTYNKPEVNHIDGIKINNFKSNLEWNTTKENIEHKRINCLGKTNKAKQAAIGVNNSQSKLTEKQVLSIRQSTKSLTDLALEYNVSTSNIHAILTRRSWKHI